MTLSENLSKVPVKNIFYMLVYAWDYPHEKDFISVFEEDEKDLINLLSKVLVMKVKGLIKKGFYKEYVETQSQSSIIKGKIIFKDTIQTFSYKKGKMHILEEDMTHDILHNQLIKATLHYLIKQEVIKKETREDITRLLSYFVDISLIKVSSRLFNEVNLHRTNKHYHFLLNFCQFIWESVLIHEGSSEKMFQDVSREHQKMAQLFESFVKNFYKRELPGSIVKSESLYWPAEGENTELLPIMKTDISLEYENEKIIIDTKFYKDMFIDRWEVEKVRSNHLYQIFSYLKTDEYYTKRKSKGILLYPKVYDSIDLKYRIHGFEVRICTLDLNQHWSRIHERLLELVF
ncbi:5-methylcytosine restriction system specificity protein McrC [Fredinandcohnia sp. 179-A 10B2 NHS]|uniref:5-methylcytosine restriction system specificity protein McrC n=1 Tax=Fredinandcohnia sp. 179-A 10B2 NHS TaxID=3235176 RepID=UPI0039A108DC